MMVLYPFRKCRANGDEEDKGCRDLEATAWRIAVCLTGKKRTEEERSSADFHNHPY